MKKRMGALLLSLVLLATASAFCLTALTGCAGEKYDLYVAGFDGAYGKEHWTELVKGFEKATGKKVKLVVESNIEKTIDPQLKAGNGPDVIYLAKGRPDKLTENLLSSGQVLDITELLSKVVYGGTKTLGETLTADAKAGAMDGDKLYTLPLFVGLNGLFYNADLFYENDGDGTYSGMKNGKYELPATWKEFKELGASLSDINAVSLFTYPTPGYMDAMIPASIATSAGESKLQQCFDYAQNIWLDTDVNRIFRELAAITPYVYPRCVENGDNTNFKLNQKAVIEGKALFMCNGDWVKGEMINDTPKGFNWGTIPYLAFEDGQQRYSSTVYEQVYIPKDSRNIDLAKQFLLYLYSDEGQTLVAQHSNAAMLATNNYYDLAKGKISDGALEGYKGYYDGSLKTINTNAWATVDKNRMPANTPGWNDIMCNYIRQVWGTEKKTADDWINEINKLNEIYRAAKV